MHYSSDDKTKNDKLYSYYLRNNANDGWSNDNKEKNFAILLKLPELTNTTVAGKIILDVGSGTGDFAKLLEAFGVGRYVGVDIFEPAILLAREKYPHHTFYAADFLKKEFSDRFDFVFCSGALTTHLHSDNYQILERVVRKMYDLCTTGIAFNFLVNKDNEEDDDLFFYDEEKVLSQIKNSLDAKKIVVEHSRVGDDYEFLQATVFVLRDSVG